MTISIIVAIDREGGIGRGGDLLFHISDDLRRFRRLTTGHTIIMGLCLIHISEPTSPR
ncbi:MAG: dihydrofolate reductase, partial [Duncaniella sp.]|nr:dihydrofolate reductase [Duncaniella sp.]